MPAAVCTGRASRPLYTHLLRRGRPCWGATCAICHHGVACRRQQVCDLWEWGLRLKFCSMHVSEIGNNGTMTSHHLSAWCLMCKDVWQVSWTWLSLFLTSSISALHFGRKIFDGPPCLPNWLQCTLHNGGWSLPARPRGAVKAGQKARPRRVCHGAPHSRGALYMQRKAAFLKSSLCRVCYI